MASIYCGNSQTQPKGDITITSNDDDNPLDNIKTIEA